MKSRESELIFIYLLFDVFLLTFSIYAIGYFNPIIQRISSSEMAFYVFHGNFSWIITYLTLSKKNLYLRDGFFNRIQRISRRTLVFLFVSLVLAYLFMPRNYSRIFLLQYTAAFFITELLFYYLVYLFLKIKRKKGVHINRALIVGINNTSQVLSQLMESNPMLGYHFLGYVTENNTNENEVLGDINQLEQIIDNLDVEIIFVTVSFFNETQRNKELLTLCVKKGIRLRFVPEHQEWFKNRINMESIGRLVIINPQEIPLDDLKYRFGKRAFDIFFSSLVILFILSWMIPLFAILIKLSSKGPVFFVQQRTGINNRPFKCLKFRSMQENPDADKKQATANDQRITKIGSFLRKTNLDEFPQFLNVFCGQMSIVGPRPHMLKHTEEYSKLIEHYLARHYVKPGITGWAQVKGYRGETDELWKMEKRVEYDMIYINNWNFVWDLEIIARTLFDKKVFTNAG